VAQDNFKNGLRGGQFVQVDSSPTILADVMILNCLRAVQNTNDILPEQHVPIITLDDH